MATNLNLPKIDANTDIVDALFTLNTNCITISSAINGIYTVVDPSNKNITSNNITVYKNALPLTSVIFTVQASASIIGNLTVGGTFNSGAASFTSLSSTGNVSFTATSGTVNITPFTIFNKGLSLTEYNTTVPVDVQTLSGVGPSRALTPSLVKDKSLIYLDFSNWTGTAPFDCATISLPPVSDPNVQIGQVLKLMVSNIPFGATLSFNENTFGIEYTNFDTNKTQAKNAALPTIYAPFISLNRTTKLVVGNYQFVTPWSGTIVGSTTNKTDMLFLTSWIEIVATTNGWVLINHHPIESIG